MTLKQEGCRGGYSAINGQTVRDALWIPCRRAGYSDRAARLLLCSTWIASRLQ